MSGFVLNIDEKLIKQLAVADAFVRRIGNTSERTRNQFNKAFSDMATIGVDGLIKRLTEAQRKFAELGGSMSTGNGLGSISAQAVKSADSVSILVQTITRLMQTTQKTGTDKIGNISNISTQASDSTKKLADMQAQLARVFSAGKQNVSNSAIAKLNEEIDASLRRLGELQKQLQYYTQGAGAKAAHSGLVDTSALQAESKMLMNKIQTLEHARNLERQAAQERLFAAQQEDAYNNKKITQEQAKREAERTSAAERSRHAREINQQYTNADNEQRQRTVKRWAEEEKAATKASQTVLAEILRQEERKERAHQAELQRKERERKETEKNERTRIRKPNELINMQGTAMNLQQLLNYANELKKTLYTLNPNTKEFTKLNNIYAQTKKQIHDIKNELGEVNNKQNSLLNGASKLGQAFGAMFSISAIKNFVTKLVQTRGEYEQQHKAMQVLLQDYNKANKVWNKTVQLAVRSPYTIQQLTSHTKQLAAYRIESDKLYDTTKRLADVSVGLGVDMQRIILAYGQVRAANFLRGTELRQFSEAGIPLLDELAKYFSAVEHTTVTAAQVFERISKRQVLFTDVDAVIQKMTDAGGIFYNMQEEMANTLKGMSSNLKDKVFLMFNEIGTETQGLLSGIIKLLGWFTENWRVLAGVLDMLLLPIIFKMGAGFIRTIKYLKLMSVTTLRANGGFLKLASTWKGLSALMLTNPIGLVITLVLSLGAAVFGLHKRTKAMNAELDKMSANTQKQITDLELQKQKVEENNKVIKDSENITNKTEETERNLAEARNSNARILDNLRAKYPEYYRNLVQQKNGTVELTDAINKQNEALRQQAIFASLAKGNLIQDSLTKNTKDFTETTADSLSKLNDLKAELEGKRNDLLLEFDQTEDSAKLQKITKEIEQINRAINRDIQPAIELLQNLEGKGMKDLYWLPDMSLTGVEKDVKIKVARWITAVSHKASSAYGNIEPFKNILANTISNMADPTEMAKYVHNALIPLISDAGLISLLESELNEYFVNKAKVISVPLKFDFKVDTGSIDKWQENYNKTIAEAISNINKDLEDSDKVYFTEITVGTSVANSQDKLIKDAQDKLSQSKDLLKRVKEASEKNGGSLVGTAYEGESIKKIEATIELQKKILDFFNVPYTKKKEKENEILSKRISLLKEMYNKYKEVSKEYSKEDAITKVLEAFEKTFEEAFRGTNIDLSIYDFITVDAENEGQQTMTDFFKGASEATKSNPYIRTFSTNLLNRVKKEEGLVLSAYDDVTSRILKKGDKVKGTITIGYGTTQYTNGMKIQIGDTITAARAEELLTESLQKRAEALNKVLDANKDLIVTQQQYDVLLDLSYQGGVGQVKWLIERAKNEEKGVQYINRIYEKVKQTMGETIASRFGTDFVTKFREAQSIVERMGMLLQTMNLTTVASGGKVDPRLYRNMQARSDRRAADFTTDLKTITEIEKVLKKVVNLDITTPEGIIDAFEKLRPIAEKEGQEAINILNKTISGFKAEVGLSIKQNERETIEQQVDSLFAQFDLSRELEKLGLSKDLMSSLFDVEYLDLDSLKSKVIEKFAGTSEEIQTELKKDVSAIDWAKMGELISEERAKEAKQSIEKITDMEAKAAKEQAKDFVKFLTEKLDETTVLMQKSGGYLSYAKKLFDEGKITAEQYSEVVNEVIKETNEGISKVNLNIFKDSDTYIKAMGSLAGYTADELKNLRESLQKVIADNSKAFSADEITAYYDAIARIAEQEQKLRSPWEKTGFAEIRYLNEQYEERNSLIAEAKNLDQQRNQLVSKRTKIEQELAAAKQSGKDTSALTNDLESNAKSLELVNSDIKKNAAALALVNGNIDKISNGLGEVWDKAAIGVAQVNNIAQGIKDSFNEIKDVAASFGVDTENESWTKAGIVIESFANATENASGMLTSLVNGDIGGTLKGLVGFVGSIIKGFNQFHDAKYDAIIKTEQKNVEKLAKAYDKLEKKIKDAMDVTQLQESSNAARENLEKQIESTQKMINAEEDKKDTDEEAVEEYKTNLDELNEKLKELEAERVKTLGGFGDIDAMKSATEEFVDAWMEAYKETGDGLDALEGKFNEFLENTIKKQIVMRGANNILKGLYENYDAMFSEDSAGGADLTTDEADAIRKLWAQYKQQLNDYLLNISKSLGLGTGEADGELSGLQAGIQGITESQAEIISAYLNSLRFFVADNNSVMKQLRDYVIGTDDSVNPMLAHLHTIAEQTSAMRKLLDSVTQSGHPKGQSGIRVFVD